MSDDPFRSPKRRLARAKENLQKFDDAVKAFIKSDPYARVVERDPDGVTEIHKITLKRQLPEEAIHLAAEIVEALRSTLDQTGYACAVLAGVRKSKSAYFPCADSAPELANVIKGRCKDLPSDIVSLFRSFQPYQGGNDYLWAMNKMANTKHTALVAVGISSGGMLINSLRTGGPLALRVPRWDTAKNEMIFAITRAGSKLDYNVKFTLEVSFGDVPGLSGHRALEALSNLASITECILAATEAECRRIGLLKT
jgi:hypothetical protein